jgi:hypothetical protein
MVDPTPSGGLPKKGKAESGVRSICRFLATRLESAEIDGFNAELARWTRQTAGERVHSTYRKQPRRVFVEEERAALQPLPSARCEARNPEHPARAPPHRAPRAGGAEPRGRA